MGTCSPQSLYQLHACFFTVWFMFDSPTLHCPVCEKTAGNFKSDMAAIRTAVKLVIDAWSPVYPCMTLKLLASCSWAAGCSIWCPQPHLSCLIQREAGAHCKSKPLSLTEPFNWARPSPYENSYNSSGMTCQVWTLSRSSACLHQSSSSRLTYLQRSHGSNSHW